MWTLYETRQFLLKSIYIIRDGVITPKFDSLKYVYSIPLPPKFPYSRVSNTLITLLRVPGCLTFFQNCKTVLLTKNVITRSILMIGR